MKTSGNSRDTSWGSLNSNKVSGGIRSNTQCSGRDLATARSAVPSSVPGSSMVRTVPTSRCWASSAKMVSGSPTRTIQFAAQRPQLGTQVGHAFQKESKSVRATPGKPARVGGQDLTRIENPHPNRRFIDPKQGVGRAHERFRRNHRSVRILDATHQPGVDHPFGKFLQIFQDILPRLIQIQGHRMQGNLAPDGSRRKHHWRVHHASACRQPCYEDADIRVGARSWAYIWLMWPQTACLCTLFGGGERFDVMLGVDDPRSLGGFMLQDDVRNQCGQTRTVRLVQTSGTSADEPSRFVSTTL